jgi:hypothetical protein
MGMLGNPKLLASLAAAGVTLAPEDSEAMYVGAKPTELGAFSSLMDRMVRKEIPDAGAKFTGKALREDYRPVKLSSILDHPELYQKYPFLKNTPVESGGPQFNPATGQIEISGVTKDYHMNDILHEIQHVIQDKEGWARGGNPDREALSIGDFLLAKRNNLDDEINNLSREYSKTLDDATRTKLQKMRFDRGQYQDAIDNPHLHPGIVGDYGQDAYKRLAGEIESRDTAARMGMSGIERSRTAPYSSENIPLSDVIVKGVQPNGQKLAYGVGGLGLMFGMGEAQAGPTIQRSNQMRAEQEALEPAMNPLEYAIPGRWGGGLMNAGIDAVMNYFTGR